MTDAKALMASINKMMGTDAVQLGSDERYIVRYSTTGLLPMDILFGGGVPRGRFIEIAGDFSTLKSFIGLKSIAEMQQQGGVAALIDTEHVFDPTWAQELGVDVNKLLLVHPETGEEAIDVAELMVRNGVDIIAFDSVAATLPQAEHGKRLSKENIQPARLAALMSIACRKLTTANSNTAIIWINQLREQIGVTFGNPEKTTGGRALGYYDSMRINIRKMGRVTRDVKMHDGDKYMTTKVQIGQLYKATIEKSKLNRPWREVHFAWDLVTGTIDNARFLFTAAVDIGAIVQKGTAGWVFGGTRFTGRDKMRQAIKDDPKLATALETAIRAHYDLPGVPVTAKKKAGASNGKRSASVVRANTRAAGQVASATTAATKKLSTKSRTLRRSTR